jgi:hypothetical protein
MKRESHRELGETGGERGGNEPVGERHGVVSGGEAAAAVYHIAGAVHAREGGEEREVEHFLGFWKIHEPYTRRSLRQYSSPTRRGVHARSAGAETSARTSAECPNVRSAGAETYARTSAGGADARSAK